MAWQVIMPSYTGFNEKKQSYPGWLSKNWTFNILSIVISEISVLYQRIKQTNNVYNLIMDTTEIQSCRNVNIVVLYM